MQAVQPEVSQLRLPKKFSRILAGKSPVIDLVRSVSSVVNNCDYTRSSPDSGYRSSPEATLNSLLRIDDARMSRGTDRNEVRAEALEKGLGTNWRQLAVGSWQLAVGSWQLAVTAALAILRFTDD